VARREVEVGSEANGGRPRQKRVARKSRQKHRARKKSVGAAGSVRRRTIW
jgi:hypothetical protein